MKERVKQLSSMYQPIFNYEEISVYMSLNKKKIALSYLKRPPTFLNTLGSSVIYVGLYFNTVIVSLAFWRATVHFFPFHSLKLLDFSLTVKAAPHECVIRTSLP